MLHLELRRFEQEETEATERRNSRQSLCYLCFLLFKNLLIRCVQCNLLRITAEPLRKITVRNRCGKDH